MMMSEQSRKNIKPILRRPHSRARSCHYLVYALLALVVSASHATAQDAIASPAPTVQVKGVVTDKMVATVGNGIQTDLITYSDLLWQLALEPDAPLENPGKAELEGALQRVINIRLIGQEAGKLPMLEPTPEEIRAYISTLVRNFPTRMEFECRLRAVGFNSIDDDNFQRIIGNRVAIEKYVDFRFRSFTIVTAQDVEEYYTQVYATRFQRENPGRVVPTLEEARAGIESYLTNTRIGTDINDFLETARDRAQIVILDSELSGR